MIYIDFIQHRLPPNDQIIEFDGIVFGNQINKKNIQLRTKQFKNKKKINLNNIKKSTKIKFINTDLIRFVDSTRHSNLLSTNSSNNSDCISENINNENNIINIKTINTNNSENFESRIIPSRKNIKMNTKSESKSSKNIVKIISLNDTPVDINNNKTKNNNANDEIEDFDINTIIIDKNESIEVEHLDDMYNYDNSNSDEPKLLLYHCLNNDIQLHMTEFIDDNETMEPMLTFPLYLRSILDVYVDFMQKYLLFGNLLYFCFSVKQIV